MINSLEWVTDKINIQHFILINSSNYSNNYYFLLKKVHFSPVPETPFQQFLNYVEPCLKHMLLITKFLRHCHF